MPSAFVELQRIHGLFGRLKQLAYHVQSLEPAELSDEWTALRASSQRQYDEIEAAICDFLGSPATRWQPRFKFYYVLPICLHLVKLFIFISPVGILGLLLYDILVLGAFAILRHPYAVSMTVSYASDLDAFPHMAKVAILYLSCERMGVLALADGLVPRVDMRPVYSSALALYALYAFGHQLYTLHHERSWQHRRAYEIVLSLLSHQVNNASFLCAFYHSYAPESVAYLAYVAYMGWSYVYERGVVIQPNFYTSHRIQHMKELYPFCHKYHHIGHPSTPMEAQEGGLLEFWAAHTGFLLGARTGWYGKGGTPTPLGFILRQHRVASAHGLWLGFLQTRTFHDLCCEGRRYFLARRENPLYRSEGEKRGAHIPCLHYYHHMVPDQQFSYDSFARLDLCFGTQHKAAEALLDECRKGTINLP